MTNKPSKHLTPNQTKSLQEAEQEYAKKPVLLDWDKVVKKIDEIINEESRREAV